MMNWLPPAVDFRQQLKAILSSTDAEQRLMSLAALARHRLNVVEMIQLDGAITRSAQDFTRVTPPVRLALLGDTTRDHLAPAVRVAGLRRGLTFDIHVGGFSQYRQELMDPSSALYRSRPQVVVLSLSAR